MRDVKIELNDSNQSLIKFLDKYINKAPKSLINKWIRTKKIKVNRKRAESSTILVENDVVNFFIYDEVIDLYITEKKRITSKLNLDIAFENKDIIVIDKPQNVLSHAASKEDYGKNVVDFIIDRLIESGEFVPRLEKSFKPSITNRLDRNTFGLIIGAKNREVLLELNKENNFVKKFYLAIVSGKISKKIEIKNRLIKDENNNVKVSKLGKESITIVRPIKSNEKYSLVEIELKTGRTHQIRASLADIGNPVIGDRRYSKLPKSDLYKDQQLVAYKLEFSKDIPIESLKGLVIKSKYEKMIIKLFDKLK